MFAACSISATSRPDQVTGFDLYQDDRDLGELEEVVQLGRCLYFVVDCRHWSYGARKLLPVAAIGALDAEQRRAFAHLDAEQIRGGPDFDPFQLTNPRYLDEVGDYFGGLAEAVRGARAEPGTSPGPEPPGAAPPPDPFPGEGGDRDQPWV